MINPLNGNSLPPIQCTPAGNLDKQPNSEVQVTNPQITALLSSVGRSEPDYSQFIWS